MQGCVRASVPGQDGVFAESRECFRQLEDWMASEETAGLQRVIEPTPEGWPLILTFDGKGVVVLPGAKRQARRIRGGQARDAAVAQERSTAASGRPSWLASTTPPPSSGRRETSSAPLRPNAG